VSPPQVQSKAKLFALLGLLALARHLLVNQLPAPLTDNSPASRLVV
jgi:hypothetical protein